MIVDVMFMANICITSFGMYDMVPYRTLFSMKLSDFADEVVAWKETNGKKMKMPPLYTSNYTVYQKY